MGSKPPPGVLVPPDFLVNQQLTAMIINNCIIMLGGHCLVLLWLPPQKKVWQTLLPDKYF